MANKGRSAVALVRNVRNVEAKESEAEFRRANFLTTSELTEVFVLEPLVCAVSPLEDVEIHLTSKHAQSSRLPATRWPC